MSLALANPKNVPAIVRTVGDVATKQHSSVWVPQGSKKGDRHSRQWQKLSRVRSLGTVLQVAQQRQQSLEALHDQGSVHIVGEGYCDSTDDSVRRRGPSQLVGAGALLGSHKLRRSKHATRCDTNAPQRQPATQTVVAVVALTRRWSHQVVAASLVRFQHRLDPRGTTRSQDLEQFHSTANTLAMCFCETVERMMCTCKVNRDASDMKTTTQSCAGPDRRRQNVGRSASR